MEGGYRSIEYRTVELADNIRSSFVAGYDNKRTDVASLHLPVECFFYSSVPNQYKVASLEIEVANCGIMFTFKANRCLKLGRHNTRMQISKMSSALLKSYRPICNQLGSG